MTLFEERTNKGHVGRKIQHKGLFVYGSVPENKDTK